MIRLLLLGLLLEAAPVTASPDTTDLTTVAPRLRLEVGAGSEVSNELFVQDTYADTTFIGRRLVGSPETRWAATDILTFERGRRGESLWYRLQQDASIGDLLQRAALAATVEGPLGLMDRWRLAPRVEYRHDRTFGRDLTQWQGELGGRYRHEYGDGAASSELGIGTDFNHASGVGADLVPDRLSGRLHAGFDVMPLEGPEWHLGYGLVARSFPDSTARDHLEHALDARLRLTSMAGHTLALELEGDRRQALHPVPTSRDRFIEARGAAEASLRLASDWALVTRGEAEGFRYDDPDSALYFDYQVTRIRVTPRLEHASWSVAIGPRAEFLSAAAQPEEEYREAGGVLELEVFGARTWWSFAPAAGWRGYRVGSAPDLPVLHSSFAFAEVALMMDQPLGAGVRLCGSGLGRVEWHQDATQDARSLYFSLELRRLL